jgi:uncharacterized protein YjbI with pentapeptide repeats
MSNKWANAKEELMKQREDLEAKGVKDFAALVAVQKAFDDYSILIPSEQESIAGESEVSKISKQFIHLRSKQQALQDQMHQIMADLHNKNKNVDWEIAKSFPNAPTMPSPSEEQKNEIQSTDKTKEKIQKLKDFLDSKEADIDEQKKNNIRNNLKKIEEFADTYASSTNPDGFKVLMSEMKAYEKLAPPLPFEQFPGNLNEAHQYAKQSGGISFQKLDKSIKPADQTLWKNGQKMQHFSVSELDFEGANLSKVEWEKLTFIHCSFINCNFEKAKLIQCRFINCDFENANLIASEFNNSEFISCSLNNANLSEAHLVGIRLFRCSANFAIFNKSQLTNTSFIESECLQTNWNHASLRLTIFHQLDFGESSFNELTAAQSAWNQCQFNSTNWVDTHLMRCAFTSGSLPRIWNGSVLKHICFRDAELDHSQWNKCNLEGIDFSHSNLHQAKFNDGQLNQVQLIGSNLSAAEFINSHLHQCLLIGADVRGTSFDGAVLKGCWLGLIKTDEATNFENSELFHSTFKPKAEVEFS